MRVASPSELERFREVLAQRFGLYFDDFKLNVVSEVLERRSHKNGVIVEDYLDGLETGHSRDELRELARELTVGETYFFRNEEQFRALREVALPERMDARAGQRVLRILSAGCATGEEPYSIATVVSELVPEQWSIEIIAADVNPAALEKARAGRYSRWSLRGTPLETRTRWFQRRAGDYVLDEGIRTMVRFEERNLSIPDPRFWMPAVFDIVFCRNMLMYLTPQAAQDIVDRIAVSLVPGGFLFLGHAETLRGVSRDFHLLHTHGTFYYQKREDAGVPLRAAFDATSVRTPPPLAVEFDAAGSWVETITRSAERIRVLTAAGQPQLSVPSGGGAGVTVPHWDLTSAVELLRRERYVESLALVDTLPGDSRRDPDVLTLRAVLLAHQGRLPEAEAVCRELLAIDDLSASAHYLTALCREGAADRAAAVDHDQTAAYLDPTFAAPRLHLGLLERKAGDFPAARRDLGQALVLLEREDASRLLLFGGGFNRDALIALCRAELVHCGGRA